jgi:hypothetical protein
VLSQVGLPGSSGHPAGLIHLDLGIHQRSLRSSGLFVNLSGSRRAVGYLPFLASGALAVRMGSILWVAARLIGSAATLKLICSCKFYRRFKIGQTELNVCWLMTRWKVESLGG